MTSPTDVARFHAEYDRHADDRVRLFGALTSFVSPDQRVLYPGSYVDIAPSVWFDDVTYVDIDKRASRFFGQSETVRSLVDAKRQRAGSPERSIEIVFHHADYREQIPVDDHSMDVLVSLYAGFISESCSRYVRPGGLLVVNDSHGDASMASLDARCELVAVVESRADDYVVTTNGLESFLQTKRGTPATREELLATNRGIRYSTSPFAYVFSIA